MLRVQELPDDERPREKLLRWGSRILSERELLSVIIGNGCRRAGVLEISRRLLADTKGLQGLLRAPISLLQRYPGLGKAKSARLAAALELASRLSAAPAEMSDPINSPQQAHLAIKADLAKRDCEELWALVLNAKHLLIKKVMISRGGLNFAAAHPREVFRECVLLNAAALILAHNHPSGDPTPSANDIKLTTVLGKCGKLLGIDVLDHIIIGDGRYVSLKEMDQI